MLHLKVLGIPMPEHVCAEAARMEKEESRKKTEAEAAKQRAKYAAKGEEAAVFASRDTDMLLRDLLARHLDKLVVPELKATCAEHQIVLDKKAKRANIVKAILSVELSKIPGLMYQSMPGQRMQCGQLKGVVEREGTASVRHQGSSASAPPPISWGDPSLSCSDFNCTSQAQGEKEEGFFV